MNLNEYAEYVGHCNDNMKNESCRTKEERRHLGEGKLNSQDNTENKGLEYVVYELLKKNGFTLTTAESATGGMIAAILINVPGISEFFEEGYITYSNAAKIKLIHVNPKTIETYGVVSKETAADMAESAAKTAGCNAALSVTGVAGPGGGTKECPVGLVYIGCHLNGKTITERCLFEGSRNEVRKAAAEAALVLLIKMLKARI